MPKKIAKKKQIHTQQGQDIRNIKQDNGKKVYTDFENTEEFNWMQENAYKYGFILRFPKDKVNETGYIYESWHYRYVGKDIAKYIHKNNISFEEYYARFIENKK